MLLLMQVCIKKKNDAIETRDKKIQDLKAQHSKDKLHIQEMRAVIVDLKHQLQASP